MKCSICGYRANSIKGMGAHYRKKHPKRMKRASSKKSGSKYCSKCGKPL